MLFPTASEYHDHTGIAPHHDWKVTPLPRKEAEIVADVGGDNATSVIRERYMDTKSKLL